MDVLRIIEGEELAGLAETAQARHVERAAWVRRTQRVQRMPTGFPSPAEDMAEEPLDLNDLLVTQPAATFFLEMAGDALLDAGIYAGDVLVVDRSLHATYGALVVAALDGVLLARHYCPDSVAIHLLPAHPDYAPISVCAGERCQVWGVVTATIHRLRPLRSTRRQM
jgi:DNA polymerase V